MRLNNRKWLKDLKEKYPIKMRILIYGSTYLTELCVNQLLKDGYNLVGYIPSENPTFEGKINLPKVQETIDHDIKLSIQYDKKLITTNDAYNLHTGLLPLYGGCSILYNTIKNKESEQGLTLHKMTEDFDKGGIISKISYPVLENDTVPDLYFRMCLIAPRFISNALSLLPTIGKEHSPVLYKKKDVPEDISKETVEEIKKRLKVKACKIIACTMVGGRDYRNTVSFPAHNQIEDTQELVLEMLKKLVALETTQQAGVPMDIYIMNNDVGYEVGNDWLNTVHGSKTQNGHIYVIHRDNTGGSFGCYHDAYIKLRNKYEWFMFTEDDLFIFGDNYYKKAIERFISKNLGFLSFIGIGQRDDMPHAHGGVGLTHKNILEQVLTVYGQLPHPRELFNKSSAIRSGEIPFTNVIHKMGYKLDLYGKESWDKDNLLLPYYNFK